MNPLSFTIRTLVEATQPYLREKSPLFFGLEGAVCFVDLMEPLRVAGLFVRVILLGELVECQLNFFVRRFPVDT